MNTNEDEGSDAGPGTEASRDSEAEMPLLRVEGITKQFGTHTAVDDLEFSLDSSGITALIGPNGAGKTVTYNLLTGKMRPTAGKIFFQGTDVTTMSAAARTRLGLGRSFQIVNIFEEMTVRENLRVPIVARNRQRFDPLHKVAESSLNDEVDRYLSLIGLEHKENARCSSLPYGDKRRVDIGIALATDPTLLLLDEPTAGMTESETKRMVELIENLERETDTSVLITEHDMNVIFSIASRILVLDRGRVIHDGPPETVANSTTVQSAYLGDQSLERTKPTTQRSTPRSEAAPHLSVEDVHTYYGDSHILQGVDLTVNRGEIVGLLGRNGAGKTTTLRSIVGETPPATGRIRFADREIQALPKHRISTLGIGYAPEERRIFEHLTVEENIATVAAPDTDWPLSRIFEVFPRLEDLRHRKGNQTSGGEQQMLTIARALATDPDLLILDEPIEGLAPVIVEELHGILQHIAETDLTVLMAEQNLEFVRSLSDYNYVLEKGQIRWSGTTQELEAERETVDRYLTVSGA